jgi:hypothetical protein
VDTFIRINRIDELIGGARGQALVERIGFVVYCGDTG